MRVIIASHYSSKSRFRGNLRLIGNFTRREKSLYINIIYRYLYRAQRVVVKRAVKVAKRMADWRWGERLGNNFKGNKNMLWKEVKRVKKG